MLTFVTFHVDSSKETAKHIATLDNRNFRNDYDYIFMINLLFRSISIFHSQCYKVVLTDMKTDLSGLDGDIEVYRTVLDPESIMFSRLIAQLDYVRTQNLQSNIVLIDSDMLVNGDLEHIFDDDFAVGLTYRYIEEVKDMPINGGIIFLSEKSKKEGIAFLEKVYNIYQDKYLEKYESWWGDQYALIEAIGYENFVQRTSNIISCDQTDIKLLDCEQYNFSPDVYPYSIAREFKEKIILHFRGTRKEIMPLYWKAYLACKEKFTIIRLIESIQTRIGFIGNGIDLILIKPINREIIRRKGDVKNYFKKVLKASE